MPWCISDLSTASQNRGVVVRRRARDEILRLFDMREVNEGLCARIAASNVAPDSWDDLVQLFGAPMEAIVESKDLHAYVQNYEILRRQADRGCRCAAAGRTLAPALRYDGYLCAPSIAGF